MIPDTTLSASMVENTPDLPDQDQTPPGVKASGLPIVTAYISIGSNIAPNAHIPGALAILRTRFGKVDTSRVYLTRSMNTSGRDFYSLVASFETGLPVLHLMRILHEIEHLCGYRSFDNRLLPKTLKLELLLYGNHILREDDMHLPRDDLLANAFVLKPLCDLAGDQLHPLLGRSYRDLWQELCVCDNAAILWTTAHGQSCKPALPAA